MSWIFYITRGTGGGEEPSTQYHCVHCKEHLANAADQLEVLGRPSRRSYFNPHGIECEIVTLAACLSYRAADYSSTEHTWFDGYAWRPLGCGGCGEFLGWRFEATPGAAAPASAAPGPRRFYGLLVERLIVV
ncbi:MAG: cereblon family protein [bacterium]